MNSMILGVRIYKVKISSDIEWYVYGKQFFRLMQSLAARRFGIYNDPAKSLFYGGLNKKFSDSFYENILNMTSNSGNRSHISEIQKLIRLSRYLRIRDTTKSGSIYDAILRGEVSNIYEAVNELFKYKFRVYQSDPNDLINKLLNTILASGDIDDRKFSMFNNVFYCSRKIPKVIDIDVSDEDNMSSIDKEVFTLKKDKVEGDIHSYILTFDFFIVFREVARQEISSNTDILVKKTYELLHKYIENSEARYSSLHFDIQKEGDLKVNIHHFMVDFDLNIYSTYFFNNQVIFIFLAYSEVDLTVDNNDMNYNFYHAIAFAFEDEQKGVIMHVSSIHEEFYDHEIRDILKVNKKYNYLMQNIKISEKVTDYIDLKKHIRPDDKMALIEMS
ncbi:MAG: hypothetical protein QXF12_05930 [Candidatus Aenigmatarchaeota archaeon]